MNYSFTLLGVLDVTNDLHMFVLHYIYAPRINFTIRSFIKGWNKHPLRTMKNWSPERIWANGMFDVRNRDLCQVGEVQDLTNVDDLAWYGYDPDAPFPENIATSDVTVNDVANPLSDQGVEALSGIDPLQQSNSFGSDIFITALETLNSL